MAEYHDRGRPETDETGNNQIMTFTDKVALIAGGTGGLGRAVSLAFLEAGARTAVTYLSDQEFADLERAAGEGARRLTGHKLDVTNEDEVRGLFAAILARDSRIDALVNAVGGYAGGAAMWESDAATLERMLALNVRSGFMLLRAAAEGMVKQGSGAMVNVAAKAALDHPAGLSAYAASKAAALAMADSLAADLKGTGVRVNTILPTIIDTETNRKMMPKANFAAWPKPEELARVILFLCSSDASAVHGAAIPVPGNR